MTPEVQIALINALPLIIAGVFAGIPSIVAAIASVKGLNKSNENHDAIVKTNANVDINNVKTDEVGLAVNGRMNALIQDLKGKYLHEKEEAVKAARLEEQKTALAHVTELKTVIAQGKSDKDILAAVQIAEEKLLKGD